MSDVAVEDFLAHYGVKGMKWGVRNEDKPSGTSPKRTKQEKRDDKSKAFTDKAAEYRTQINELKTKRDTTTKTYERGVYTRQIRSLQKKEQQAKNDAKASKEGRLTTNQKRALIAGGVVLSVVAYKELQSGDARRMVMKGKAFVLQQDMANNYRIKGSLFKKDMSPDEIKSQVIPFINPNYGLYGANNNCRRCTFAYELRRRGYDVQATLSPHGSGQNAVGLYNALNPDQKNVLSTGKLGTKYNIIKQLKLEKSPILDLAEKTQAYESFDNLFAALKGQPERSRGEISTAWSFGGGHSMAYEIINGVPHIFDGQTGKVYDSVEKAFTELPPIRSTGFTRLDNVPLNMDFIARWVKNA